MTVTDVAVDPSAIRSSAAGPSAQHRAASVPTPLTILPNLLRSEWAKIRTVRSTYWTLIAAAIAIGLGTVIAAAQSGTHAAALDPIGTTLGGVLFAQLAIGVLGALAVTTEYSTGMIRSTLVAAPQRRLVIAAKATVLAAIALVVGTLASVATFLAGQAILGANGVSLGSPGALRSVIGVGLYLGLIAIFAVGLGTIVRSSVGAIAVLFGLLFALPMILTALPSLSNVDKFLPSNAGSAIFHSATPGTTSLSPWAGLAVLALYVAATLGVSLIVICRRDA